MGFVRLVRNWPAHYLATYGLGRPAVLTYHLRNGLSLEARPRTLDVAVLRDIFLHGVYTPAGFEAEGGRAVVLDVGAHIGAFAAHAARMGPGVTVFAFEPAPENFALLSRNVVRNGLSNVQVSQCAVSGVSGTRELHLTDSPAEHSLHIVKPGSHRLAVPSVTLADILDRHGLETVDLLKMDCEGAEYEILEAAIPDALGRVRRIAMEAHALDGSRTPRRLVALLEAQGFAVKTGFEGEVTTMIWASRPSRGALP